jgi:hypothetical protein
MARTPRIELLWWEGCPSTDRALAELTAVVSELGLDAGQIAMRQIRTDEQALGELFAGSPTVLIDGVDALRRTAGAGDDEPPGLGCRVYRRRDGRIAPTPDPLDLRDALAAARGRGDIQREGSA